MSESPSKAPWNRGTAWSAGATDTHARWRAGVSPVIPYRQPYGEEKCCE